MNIVSLTSDISVLQGVGKTRKAQLNKLGIFTVLDLIYHFPRSYENRGNISPISSAALDVNCSFILTVGSEVKTATIKRGFAISKFKAFDESGTVEIVFFNSPYIKDVFHTGSLFRFYGKLTVSKNKVQLVNPKYEAYIDGMPLQDLVPIYPLTEGISSKFLDKLISEALNTSIRYLDDPLPEKIRIKNELPTLSYSISNLHAPKSNEDLEKAIRRLAFDELLLFGLGVSRLSYYKDKSIGFKFKPCDLSPILSLLPFELTASQKNAVNEIYKDTVLSKGEKHPPMSRIIVGDVGCGKTVCAILAIYIAVKSGYQAALMAPTEILARQHYAELSSLFEKLNIPVRLLIGATKPKEKSSIINEISNGEIFVAVGTHALLSKNVSFKKLGLIITDEQHRFGVKQRAVLKEKNSSAHMLVMSATPIPRSLALTLYGDLDLSKITEMPKGRTPVATYVVDESYRERLNDFIKKQVELGGQCYIVCPAIEDETDEEYSEEISSNQRVSKINNVKEYTEKLRQSLPNISISCLHGKMKSKEKDELMLAFSKNEIKCLVSTTVIEVGINVPNASLMIIENAERFGLAQLHQLRGRVGRGSRKSYCVLVEGNKSEKSTKRLEVMRTTYDGFEIAEKDLIERGPGDFLISAADPEHMRQSGGFSFKMASLANDSKIIEKAFAAAREIITDDPNLMKSENSLLRERVLYTDYDSSTIS